MTNTAHYDNNNKLSTFYCCCCGFIYETLFYCKRPLYVKANKYEKPEKPLGI